MPIYEYECAACGHRHEALQKLGESLLCDCPACGKSELRKLVSAAGFRLAGSGWYETDFKTGDKRNLASGSDEKSNVSSKSSQEGGQKPSQTTKSDTKQSATATSTHAKGSKPATSKKPPTSES